MHPVLFREAYDIEKAFDDLLRRVAVPMRGAHAQRSFGAIPMDVIETPESYRLAAELPGVPKQQVEVKVLGKEVTIVAAVESQEEEKGETRTLRAERYHGKRERTVVFDQEINEEAASAELRDGVLYLTLPKKAAAATRRLTIN